MPVRSSVPVRFPRDAAERRYAPEEERRGGRFPTGPCGRNPVGIGLRAGPEFRAGPVFTGGRGKKVRARRGTPRRAIPYRPMRPEPCRDRPPCRSGVPCRSGCRGRPRKEGTRQKRNAAEGDSLQAHAAGTLGIGLRAGPVAAGCRGKKVRARRGTPRRAIPYRPMRPEPCRDWPPCRSGCRGRPRKEGTRQKRNAAEGDSLQAHAAGTL